MPKPSTPSTASPLALPRLRWGSMSQCLLATASLCAALFVPALHAQSVQTITGFAPRSPVSFGTAPATLTASGGGSGNPIVFATTSANTICTVSASQVTFVGVGICDLTANQAGDATYSAAPQVTQSIAINAASQSIIFGANPGPRAFAGALAFFVSSTGGASGNPVILTSLTTGICNVSNNALVFINAVGICVIAANQAGTANYLAAAQSTQDIIITQGTQTINFGANPGPVTYSAGGMFSVNATATGYTGVATGPVTFTSVTTSVCTVIGNTVSTVTAGTCGIAANQLGNANIDPAPQVTQNITIRGIPQSISFDVPPTVNVGDSGTLFGNGGASGNPVTFTSTTPTVCTMAGSTFTAVAGGSCTIAADQAGNEYYAVALRATRSLGVIGALPVVTLSAVVSRKQHVGIDRDIVIDHTLAIGGNISTEPRSIGAGHRIVFQFSGPINLPGFAGAIDSAMFDVGMASAAANPLASNEVVVTVTDIPDNRRVTVSLTNVNGIATPFTASVGFLVGDVNGTRSVNSSDISGVKARSGQNTDALNFRFDVNASGTINSSDISAVKARSGLTLAP